MSRIVWIMSFKIKILKSSPLAMNDSEYAVAEAVTFAHYSNDAFSQLIQQLENAKLELIEIYQNVPFEDASQSSVRANKEDIIRLIEEVKISGEFRFGIFRAIEEDI